MKIQFPAVLAASLFAPMASAADYLLMQVDYPGVASTEIRGVNDRGDAVGVGLGQGEPPVSFVYNWKTGTFRDVPAASSDTTIQLAGINDAGVVVGSVWSLDPVRASGFIRGTDGAYKLLFHPEATSLTHARDVSDSGLVTGIRDVGGRLAVGFVYDPATDIYLDIVPSHYTIAHGINASGEIVGSALFYPDGACPGTAASSYGWLRARNGSVTFFQVNGQFTEARGINEAGLITGNIADDETGIRHAFVVHVSGLSRCEVVTAPASHLLQFPGYDEIRPQAITNTGVVVGLVENAGDTIRHGFVATPR